MAFDDLPLDRPAPPPQPPRLRTSREVSPARWVVAGAGAGIVGGLLMLWWMSRAQPRTAIPAPTQATDVAVGSNRPRRQPLDLPAIDASDSFLREMVATLSRHPLVARLLATDGIVRNTALAVEQIGDGRTPFVVLKPLRPAERLTIASGPSGRIEPRAYARWDSATSGLVAINPNDLAQLYVIVKPLFDGAYRELGHPGGDFDASIVRAMQMLADTPTLSAAPELLRRPGYYEYADPGLKAIPPVQKQFLLIGPDNRQKVMAWLTRLAAALDLKI